MKNKLLKIINNYGVNNQLRKFNEEAFELQEAIIKCEWDKFTRVIQEPYNKFENNIAEEIADCFVMLEQFRLYYNISKDKIKTIMEYKINRQIDRIKKEDNE